MCFLYARRLSLAAGLIFGLVAVPPASAQLSKESPPLPEGGVRLDKSLTQRWRVGVTITAPNGYCTGVFGTATVPTVWPEQQVKLVEEDVSLGVKVKFRTLNNGVKQMLVSIPKLPANETAHALMTFEVTKHSLLPPTDTSVFREAKVTQALRPFLTPSPLIESRHNLIINQAKAVVKDADPGDAWGKVERIYDWVRDHVEYKEGPIKGALAAIKDGDGDCEELTSLFIAMCRANKIPARTVWVPGHCYPEFYLVDDKGQGHWLPCQAAGSRDFGSMPDFRPILQKGDNFRVPEKRTPQRYVAEFLKVNAVRGTGQPTVVFTRKLLPADG